MADRTADLTDPGGARLGVDWTRCDAHGLCHELLPEVVDLDDWGYPVVTGTVPERLLAHADTAVRMCPVLALRLSAAVRSRG